MATSSSWPILRLGTRLVLLALCLVTLNKNTRVGKGEKDESVDKYSYGNENVGECRQRKEAGEGTENRRGREEPISWDVFARKLRRILHIVCCL